MKLNLGKALTSTLLGACLSTFSLSSFAAFPEKPVTLVVPYGAGGTTDVSARKLASMAESVLGQPVVVENRPGGSGTNAMRSVAKAKPDGYTLIATTSSPMFVTPAVRSSGYNTSTDFTPLLNYSGPYHGVAVQASSPYQSFEELIAAAKSQRVSFGTAGALGGAHLAFELVAKETQTQLKHVPFKGAAATTAALLGGHVEVALIPAYRDLVQDGQLRILGVLDGSRDPDFPSVPTLKELGYNAEFPSLVGLMVPKGTDQAAVDKLTSVFTEQASSDEFKQFMTKMNQPVRIMSGDALAEIIRTNLETFGQVARELKGK